MFLVCWSLVMTLLAGYYWFKFNDVQNRIGEGLISVSLGVDYGNGTREWHNDTNAFAGETLFDITKQIWNVTYDVGSLGTLITGINNVTAEGSYGFLMPPRVSSAAATSQQLFPGRDSNGRI